MEDERTDEALALAYSEGDESAAGVLFHRYEKPLWRYAWRLSRYKDKYFIDDIVQITLVLIFRLLKAKEFHPRFAGAFKAWVFNTCEKTTYNENYHRGKSEKPITDDYLTDLSSEVAIRRVADSIDTRRNEERRARLQKALAHLKPIERKLLELRQADSSYEQIQDEPEFRQNNAGQLRVKYCRILETLRKYIRGEKR